MEEKKKEPIKRIRIGRIRASIWANGTEESGTPWYTVTPYRSYKEKDGSWCDVKSFNYSDLPCVGQVLEDAMSWIREQTAIDAREVVPGHPMDEGTATNVSKVGRKKRRSK